MKPKRSRVIVFMRALMHDDIRRLKQFSISTLIFFISYSMVYWSESNIPPSLKQEITAAAILAVMAIAFFWAVLMQIFYILSRILKK